MSTKYNGLEPSEEELVEMLIEEASEVIFEACKILRHGKVATDHLSRPPREYNNAGKLALELAELMTVADACVKRGILDKRIFEQHDNEACWMRKLAYTHQQLDSEAGVPGKHTGMSHADIVATEEAYQGRP